MKTIEVESLSDSPNYAVVKLPERQYPALLVQGDSLKIMADLAVDIQRMTKKSRDPELRAAADEMAEQLMSRLEHYERSMAKQHRALPYTRLKRAV